jgi:hypothetical protein
MRRIYLTFYTLSAIAVLAAGGVSTGLNQPAGVAAATLFLASAAVGALALALASRILYMLGHPKTSHVPVRRHR